MNELSREKLKELNSLVLWLVKNTTVFLIFIDRGKMRSADAAFQSVQDVVLNAKVGESNGYYTIPIPALRYHKIGIEWTLQIWSRVAESYCGYGPIDVHEHILEQTQSPESEEALKMLRDHPWTAYKSVPCGWVLESPERVIEAVSVTGIQDGYQLVQWLNQEYRDLVGGADFGETQWVTRKRIHEIATRISQSTAPKPKQLSKLPGFQKVKGKKDYVADYQELLPHLREKWPEISWPSQLSSWE